MAVTIIAEAGVNHDGKLEQALALVDAAAEAGADIVKFQTFRATEIAAIDAPKADYQKRTTGTVESQFEMLRRLELSDEAHHVLRRRCAERGIEFLSTPFDLPSLRFLTQELRLPRLKLPSGEITNAPLLHAAAATGVPVILSTGMCTLADVEDALGVLAHGYLGLGDPSSSAFAAAFASAAGRAALAANVTLLHCTTEYPAPPAEVNLRAMGTLSRAFGLPVGFSDHTEGLEAAVAATALGAVVIEKHMTLDRSLPGPDHKASLEPAALAQMVRSIRAVETMLGEADKRPTATESRNMMVARKSLVATGDIAAGDPFTMANLGVKRPGDGLSPARYWDLLGRPAGRAYRAGERIEP
ncbi:N,N'-diacetyllegionaminic acid synthase [Magnetospirillum sp. LM-5]|uniref:N-acetylneuraminate synthase n=1 Tax=Magnetospirillum sp. LM-5 TaxID=2681466 RepID=UPI0013810926|nr:N-acetylneuraminate synthase [Magnetospirillum sp. LM-5]CAA7622610.1 N,N'-diacetyllegionaminic acid synthase [Magnetospirillum sp. LM-5]